MSGQFQKGQTPWNKGKKGSIKPNSGSFKPGFKPWNKGIKGSSKTNSGSFKKGLIPWNKGVKGIKPWSYGKKFPEWYRKKLSDSHKGKFIGPDNPGWKGGRYIDKRGYVSLTVNGKKIYEHRVIMEKHIGRNLKRSEIVHHKNHDKTDNRIENLELLSNSDHGKLHTPKGSKVGFHIKKMKATPCRSIRN